MKCFCTNIYCFPTEVHLRANSSSCTLERVCFIWSGFYVSPTTALPAERQFTCCWLLVLIFHIHSRFKWPWLVRVPNFRCFSCSAHHCTQSQHLQGQHQVGILLSTSFAQMMTHCGLMSPNTSAPCHLNQLLWSNREATRNTLAVSPGAGQQPSYWFRAFPSKPCSWQLTSCL